jgi:hypothetical protein
LYQTIFCFTGQTHPTGLKSLSKNHRGSQVALIGAYLFIDLRCSVHGAVTRREGTELHSIARRLAQLNKQRPVSGEQFAVLGRFRV